MKQKVTASLIEPFSKNVSTSFSFSKTFRKNYYFAVLVMFHMFSLFPVTRLLPAFLVFTSFAFVLFVLISFFIIYSKTLFILFTFVYFSIIHLFTFLPFFFLFSFILLLRRRQNKDRKSGSLVNLPLFKSK